MAAVAQPSGTVTLVFTDIEGSTRLLEELGTDRYREALAEHRRIVREACARHAGYEVDTEGDAFFYAFQSAQAAVAAVAEAMQGLDRGPIRIRVGIHTGEPALDPPNYLGLDVHRAARIMASGHGGQVVLSPTTVALLEPGSVQLKDLGQHRLKDLTASIPLHQLVIDGLPGEHPPLKTLYRTNLPVPATPFLGREQELAEIVGRLTHPDTRLLTLTGPGGTGKTRLALQAAANVAETYPEGVYWVPLASLRDPTLVLTAVAHAVGVRERPAVSPLDSLAAALLNKKALLLLDNAEHLLPGAADELAPLVATCPTLRLLVTSRERLRIRAESTWPVPPLQPSDGELLFVQRARAAGVELDDEAPIPELCRRLEDLPLAIELAVARMALFTPAQLLERLGERLDLLRGERDVDPRQQTLRATIEWSYQLLGEREQLVYRALSAFPGGCTYEGAETVAAAEPDTLQSLVDKSLVRVRDDEAGRRYWMLETIRQHAREHLDASTDAEAVRRRLAHWLLDLADEADEAKWGPEHDAHAARIEAEHPNIVETLHWLRERDPNAALRLATIFAIVAWDGGTRAREGRSLLELALSEPNLGNDHARAIALYAIGRLAWTEDDRSAERTAFQECIELARRSGDTRLETLALAELGWTALAEDGFDEARRHTEAASEASTGTDDAQLEQRILQLRGALAERRGDLDDAWHLHEEALALARSTGNRRGAVGLLGNLAWVALLRGDYASTVLYCRESLALVSPSDVENRAYIHGNLGLAALFLGDNRTATEHLSACLTLCRQIGMQRVAAEALTALAARAARSRRPKKAVELWAAAEALHSRAGSSPTPVEERLRSTFLEPLRPPDGLPTVSLTLEEAVDDALGHVPGTGVR